MKPLKMRERRSLRRYHEEFGGAIQVSVLAFRFCSFVLPLVALLGVASFAMAHSGDGHYMAAAAAAPVLAMTAKSKELRTKRAALIQEMHDLTEKTGFPKESQERWAAADKEQKALEVQIRAVEESARLTEEMREVIPPPQGQPSGEIENKGALGAPEAAIKRYNDRIASPEYRAAFVDFLRNGERDCRSESRNLLSVALQEARTYTGLNVGTGSQGGYVVPVGFQRELEQKMKAYGRMRENCRVLNTSTGNTLDWPTYDDTSNSGEFLSENVAVSQQNPTFGQVQFSSYLASSKQVLISVQLMQDSAFDLEGELSMSFGIRLGRITNAKYTNGNGTGCPTGLIYTIVDNEASPNVVNAAGSNTNDGAGGTAENSIGSDDLDNLIAAVDPAYRVAAMFMMHWKTIDYLRKLKDKYGRPLWVSGLAEGEPDRIFGYPFDWNADMDTIGSSNSAHTVLFGDFSKYVIRDVGGITVVRYNELYMPNHQIGFQAYLRTDGQVIQQAAFSLLVNNSSGS